MKWIVKAYKMADAQSIFKSKFDSFSSTLKETSYDDKNDKYLCQDNIQIVYDFDKITKERYPTKQPSSYDSLFIVDKKIYCIEFKNQKYSDIDREIIRKKLINGKDILDKIFEENNIAENEYKFIYCVAYKNSATKWRRGITKNTIQFDLEEYQGKYFDEIYTNDVQFFTHEYKKHFKKELQC